MMMQRSDKFDSTFLSKQFNYVPFDPNDKKHRAAFLEFKISGKWPNKLRFKLDPLYTNVPSMINQQLLNFYFDKDRHIPTELKETYAKQSKTYPIGALAGADQHD